MALLCGLAFQARHNGKLALAQPVAGIELDGDLSDWPEDMVHYPLLLTEYGAEPEDAEDFQGSFRLGYNELENALFIAVEVQDESSVLETAEKGGVIAWGWSWQSGPKDTEDGCEIYVDMGHGEWVVKHTLYGKQPENGIYRYEWRIPGREVQLRAGMVLGVDVVVPDRDEDGSFSWMAWGRGLNKTASANRVGDVMLVDGEVKFGEVRDLESLIAHSVNSTESSTRNQMLPAGVLLAFTLLHLLLFSFYPRSKSNLYYAIFTGVLSAYIFFNTSVPDGVMSLALMLVLTAGLRFLYSLFYPGLPGRFWIFIAGLSVGGILVNADFGRTHNLSDLVIPVALLVVFAETLSVILKAIGQKKDGAWITGAGFAAFFLITGYLFIQEKSDMSLVPGSLLLIVSMSVYLARRVARTSKDLEAQLVQVQELSARTLEQNQALEEANRQIQEATQRKSEFLASMSHDLRTPMNAIIGYTRILLRKATDALKPRQYRNLENIQASADHLLGLINDILDLSKIEAGRMDVQPEEVDLEQLVAGCMAAVESLLESQVELRRHLEAVKPLRTDPERLRRVLMNLLGNAVKFTEKGSITVSLKAAGDRVELAVADTGVGIPAGDLPHIFDEFQQVSNQGGAQKEGTGLGLAIAKKSVELLGGKIEAESEVGKGTTFTIWIADYEG